MFGDIGVPELLIILAIVVLLFGVGRVGRLGKDLGTSIKEFRKAVNEDDKQGQPNVVVQSPPQLAQPQQVMQQAPAAPQHAAAAYHEAAPPKGDQNPPTIF